MSYLFSDDIFLLGIYEPNKCGHLFTIKFHKKANQLLASRAEVAKLF